jgi:uncharacterized protein YwlG (UPF0340 family)
MRRPFFAIRTGDNKAEEKIDEVFQALIAEQEDQGMCIYTIQGCQHQRYVLIENKNMEYGMQMFETASKVANSQMSIMLHQSLSCLFGFFLAHLS